MATNIVPSLFGLTQQQVRQQQLAEDQQFANEYAASLPPAYRSDVMVASRLGSGLARGIAGLFGLQTPAEKQASAMDEALKVATQSLPPEQRGNRAALMGKLSEVLSANPNFQREALAASMQANEFLLEDEATKAKTDSYRASQESSIASANLNKIRATQETLDNKQKELQLQGQIGIGALEAYKKSTNPDSKNRIWNNTLKSFESLGIDVSTIRDLPESERESFLQQAVESSKTSMERIREEANISTAQYRQKKLELDTTKLNRTMAFKETQAKITNSFRATTQNLASSKFNFEQKKVLFSQANDLLKANERQLDDVRADLQDDIDEREKLETGKQFGLSPEATEVRKKELDARIEAGRKTVKQGELILKQSKKELENTRFNPAPGMASDTAPLKPSSNKTYMSDADAKSMLGAKYKPGYKFFVEGGRIKGEPI